MTLRVTKQITYVLLVVVAVSTTLGACNKVLGETPIQGVVNTALDHSIETLTSKGASYRSQKNTMERLHGPDLRDPNRSSIKFDLYQEVTYERLPPDRERAVMVSWREYADEPEVRYPVNNCDLTWVVIATESFDQACDGSWSQSIVSKTNTSVEADLRDVVDVDALTQVDDAVHRNLAVAVYEGFASEGGELRHVLFKIGLDDGVIRYASINAATVAIEWEHFDLRSTDIVIKVPTL